MRGTNPDRVAMDELEGAGPSFDLTLRTLNAMHYATVALLLANPPKPPIKHPEPPPPPKKPGGKRKGVKEARKQRNKK